MTLPKKKEALICLDVLMHYSDCTCAGGPLLQEVRAWQILIKQPLSEDKLLQNRADRQHWKCCFPWGSICGNVRALLASDAAQDWWEEPSKFSKVLLGFKIQLQPGVPCYPADAMSHKCNLNSCFLMECILLIAQKSVLFFFLYNESELFICMGMEFCQEGLCQVVSFSNVKTRMLVSAGREKWKSYTCKECN